MDEAFATFVSQTGESHSQDLYELRPLGKTRWGKVSWAALKEDFGAEKVTVNGRSPATVPATGFTIKEFKEGEVVPVDVHKKGQGSQPSSSQRIRDPGLEELWKQLAEAKETNGFLELPALIKKIFPKASAGKLLVLDSYKKLLRIIEQRSGAKLLSDEQSSSNLSQSKQGPVQTDAMPSPSKKQKTESDQSCSGNEIQDTEMANVDEGFHLFEPDDSSPVPELPEGYVDRAMGVTGTPGIGKTMFLTYLLHFLASNGKTVVLYTCDRKEKYMFSRAGCFRGSKLIPFVDELDHEDTFFLVDSEKVPIYCAMTILVSSPRKSIVEDFRKSGKIYYMPVWTIPELNKLLNAVYRNSRNIKDVEELYRQWGGCVRWVLEKPKKESENLLEDSVKASTADNLLAACKGYNDDKVSNRIVHHVPTDDMELLKEVVLASKHVSSMVYKKLANDTTHNHIWFLRQSAGDRRCATMRGNIFEEHVVETQSRGEDIKYPCKANSNDVHTPGHELAPVSFPAGEVKRFRKAKEITAGPANAVWWPLQTNHQATDFFRQPNELCQVTISENHDPLSQTTIEEQFKSLLDYKDGAKPLFFSFIVPEDVYPVVHKIPGIEVPSEEEISKKLKKLRENADQKELKAIELRLKLRVQWRILKVPFLSAIEDQVANLHV